MTYAEHASLSLFLAWTFFKASVCALAHALYPEVCITSSTRCLAVAAERIRAAGCRHD